MTSFITGIAGFVGTHLTTYLKSIGDTVIGIDQAPSQNLADHYKQIDLLDTDAIANLLTEHKPDHIYHLAAISFVPDNANTPKNSININIMGTTSLLDAVKKTCPEAKTLVIGSLKEYGHISEGTLISETTPCLPKDFYGVTKYAAELICQQYSRQFNLDIRFSRSFNHTGPGQSNRFVCSDWAHQCALITKKKQLPEIKVGDTHQKFDFLDVRDVVKAYRAILSQGNPNETYNVCKGEMVTLQEVLTTLMGFSSVTITPTVETARLRPGETKIESRGDKTKIHNHTGWEPTIPLSKTLHDLYNYWLERV